MRIREAIAATHPGRRGNNEDAVLRMPRVPLFAVADGMGGMGAGDVAANIALATVKARADELASANARVAVSRSTAERLALGALVDNLFNQVSRQVQQEALRLGSPGMATTLLLVTLIKNFAYIAHVGDSRAYLIRNGQLMRLTEDHTVAELHLKRGRITREQYERSPERRVLYQALGAGGDIDGDLAEIRLMGGDVLLLCSDGLFRALSEEQIYQQIDSKDLRGSTQRLLDAAIAAGAPDNVSAVLLTMEAELGDEPIEAVTDRMRDIFLFQELTQPELLTIAPYLEEVVLEKDVTLWTEGELWDQFALVLSGTLRLSSGKTVLEDIRPGGWFGEFALARSRSRAPTVRTLSPSRLFTLTRHRFLELLRHKPELGNRLLLALLEHTTGRVADLSDRLVTVERAIRGELK